MLLYQMDTPMEIFQSSRKDAAKADPDMEWDFPVTSGETLTCSSVLC